MAIGPYQSTQFRGEEGGSVKDFHLQLTGQNSVAWSYLAPVEARKSLYTRWSQQGEKDQKEYWGNQPIIPAPLSDRYPDKILK